MPQYPSAGGNSTPAAPARDSQPTTTTTGLPRTSASPPPGGHAPAPNVPESPSGRATSQSPAQAAQQPISKTPLSPAQQQQPPPPPSRDKEGEFEVVQAPAMLEGEKPAPTSSPLIDLMRARAKALAMGQCEEEKYY